MSCAASKLCSRAPFRAEWFLSGLRPKTGLLLFLDGGREPPVWGFDLEKASSSPGLPGLAARAALRAFSYIERDAGEISKNGTAGGEQSGVSRRIVGSERGRALLACACCGRGTVCRITHLKTYLSAARARPSTAGRALRLASLPFPHMVQPSCFAPRIWSERSM